VVVDNNVQQAELVVRSELPSPASLKAAAAGTDSTGGINSCQFKTQETCKPVPPRWTTAKIQAEKRVCVLCVNPAICAVCAVLAVRSFNNLRWHNRGRGFESHPLRHPTLKLRVARLPKL
jgi:hypothetical protein